MKRVLLVVLLAACTATAGEFDVSAGASKFPKYGNGIWYQEAFPHTLEVSGRPSLGFGFSESLLPNVRGRVAYTFVGRVTTDALAVGDDNNYDFAANKCKTPCLPLGRWRGSGEVHSVSATLAPYITTRYGDLFVEGGVTAYKPSWKMTVDNWTMRFGDTPITINVSCVSKVRLGSTFGLGFRFKQWTAVVSKTKVGGRTHTDNDGAAGSYCPAIYKDHATNFSMRYSF